MVLRSGISSSYASRGLLPDELSQLEQPYTPRYDFQGVSDEAELRKIREQIPGYADA